MFTIQNFRLFENNQPVRFVQSPNVDVTLQERRFVVIHYTGGAGFAASVAWLASRKSGVSAHIVIGRNGEVAQLVPFNLRAWHAGESKWREFNGLNNYSIGIELDNAGLMKRSGNRWVSSFGQVYPDSDVLAAPHKSTPNVVYGWHKYTDVQLQTAAQVVAALVKAYGIQEIIGHDDIAIGRKWDPGPAFPMEQFREQVAALVQAQSGAPAEGGPVVIEPPSSPSFQRYRVTNLDTGGVSEYRWSAPFLPASLLPVPYVSQLGPGADSRQNDCGAASAIMLLRAYFPNLRMTPDEFYTRFNIPGRDPYLSVNQLRGAMGSMGLFTDFQAGLTMQDLFNALAAVRPPIVLLRYSVLQAAGLTERDFSGPHFAVVVGMDIRYIYLHDPLYTQPAHGEARPYPLEVFWRAWKEVAADPKFPNPERSAILPSVGIGAKTARRVKVNVSALNVRASGSLNAPVLRTLKQGEVVEVVREVNGWGELDPAPGWILLSYTVPA
ncbi:MAG: N-acetylmuramoyl-L-alanine amidase [Anaerolineales bacterium]|nr:N-acetylmuramoyl-L-alanine amidase [Anaerolineales bacterium]